MNVPTLLICVIISFVIRSFISMIGTSGLDNTQPVSAYLFVATVISAALSFVFACIFNSNKARQLILHLAGRTPNKDIWLDVLDRDLGNDIIITTTDGRYIVGSLFNISDDREKITLTGYICYNQESEQLYSYTDLLDTSQLMVDISMIREVRLIYFDDSNIGKKIKKRENFEASS